MRCEAGHTPLSWALLIFILAALFYWQSYRLTSDRGIHHTDGKNMNTFVVAGGGSIGLSTAYYLASGCRSTGRLCKVIVVDALEDLWDSSSGYNSGIISWHWMNETVTSLGKYSYQLFRDLSKDTRFQEMTGIRDHTVFTVDHRNPAVRDKLPSWTRVSSDWNVRIEPEDGSAMSLKPKGLGSWLLERCNELQVEIWTQSRVFGVSTTPVGKVSAVAVLRDGSTQIIPCQHLVLSAGAWTPPLLKTLFPNARIDLKPVTDGGSYVVIENPAVPGSSEQQAALLVEGGHSIGSYAEIIADDAGKIWICSIVDSKDGLPDIGRSASFPAVESSIQSFIGNAKDFVEPIANGNAKLRVLEQGRVYRPTNEYQRPIIASVPIGRLGIGTSPESDLTAASGVYLCTGHSYFGITQGLGSGKIMSDIILGQETEIDATNLGLPEEE